MNHALAARELPVLRLDSLPAFIPLAIVALLVAVLLFVVAMLVFRRRARAEGRLPERSARRARKARPASEWQKDLRRIRTAYDAGEMSETEAYSALSALARRFASQRLGTDFSSSTLLDLNQHHQVSSKEQFRRLRQTIAALYPPEFAPKSDARTQQASVDAAARWVSDLFERWDK